MSASMKPRKASVSHFYFDITERRRAAKIAFLSVAARPVLGTIKLGTWSAAKIVSLGAMCSLAFGFGTSTTANGTNIVNPQAGQRGSEGIAVTKSLRDLGRNVATNSENPSGRDEVKSAEKRKKSEVLRFAQRTDVVTGVRG